VGGVRVVQITDPADERLADFRDLTDADVRPDRRGIVIAEGVNVVARLAASPYPMRAVVGVAHRIEALRPVLEAHDAQDVTCFVVDKWLLSDVVGFRVTRGVLASADRVPSPPLESILGRAGGVAVLEGLNDFENLGALFRNAAAFGVDAVLLDARCADPLYRRSVRVSMGHVLQVPFRTMPDAWPESLQVLRDAGLRLYALTPDPSARPLREVTAPPRWAVLLGAEGPGLTEAAMALADERVRIPMAAGVDSLNVATAAAVTFSHLS
jgi:tRNA G18 (ribose-2'-O)-methylase SpoU